MTPDVGIIGHEPLSDAFLKLNRYRLARRVPDTGQCMLVDRECVELFFGEVSVASLPGVGVPAGGRVDAGGGVGPGAGDVRTGSRTAHPPPRS